LRTTFESAYSSRSANRLSYRGRKKHARRATIAASTPTASGRRSDVETGRGGRRLASSGAQLADLCPLGRVPSDPTRRSSRRRRRRGDAHRPVLDEHERWLSGTASASSSGDVNGSRRARRLEPGSSSASNYSPKGEGRRRALSRTKREAAIVPFVASPCAERTVEEWKGRARAVARRYPPPGRRRPLLGVWFMARRGDRSGRGRSARGGFPTRRWEKPRCSRRRRTTWRNVWARSTGEA